jgi:methylglyoxal synthase
MPSTHLSSVTTMRPEIDPRLIAGDAPGHPHILLLPRRPAVLLLAHEQKMCQLVDLAICYRDVLASRRLLSTSTMAWMLEDMAGLTTEAVGNDGGVESTDVLQCISDGDLAAVIFLVDPFGQRRQEPDVQVALRACSLRDVPLATNIGTAGAVLHMLSVLEASGAVWGQALESK